MYIINNLTNKEEEKTKEACPAPKKMLRWNRYNEDREKMWEDSRRKNLQDDKKKEEENKKNKHMMRENNSLRNKKPRGG